VSEAATEKKQSETQRVRALVDRAQQGDRGALEELYLIHFDRIYSYLHVCVVRSSASCRLPTLTCR